MGSKRFGFSRASIDGLDFTKIIQEENDGMSKVCGTAKDFEFDKPEIKLVTPGFAKELLAESPVVSIVPKTVVANHAHDILNGFWKKPKHTVVLSSDGSLMDGHEFLHAVVRSGVSVKLLFVSDKESTGKPKQMAVNPQSKTGECLVSIKNRINTNGSHPRLALGDDEKPLFEMDDPTGIVMKIEVVTPEQASEYLEKNTRNRKIRQHKVSMYAAEMLSGNWKLNHQGIAFYEDGTLADGQHRLLAVIQAGIPIKMLVVRGIDRSSGTTLDIGGVRNDVDLASALGVGANFNNKESAVGKAMNPKQRNGKTSRQDSLRFTIRHLDAIRFAMSVAKTGAAANSVVRSVVARAYYSVDHGILERFSDIVGTGYSEGIHESSAVALRNYILRDVNCLHTHNGRQSTILKAHAALRAFISGQPLAKLQEPRGLIFMLPGEEG